MDAQDLIAIRQLVDTYVHAADHPDQSMLREVFTADAVVDLRRLGRGLVEGLSAIERWFALGKPPHPPAHHTTNPLVRESEGVVTVWSKWFVVNPRDGSGATGDYHDVVVRTSSGWRIVSRTISVRYPAVLDFTP